MYPILYQSLDLTIFSYPLLMGLGWGIAYQIFFALCEKQLSWKLSQVLYWGVFVSAWVGSKVLFYFTLPEHLSRELLSQVSFWTGGGFVFYGGLIFALGFLVFYHLFINRLTDHILWALTVCTTFGHAIGRVGCLLAGCCYGSPTDLWWGIFLHEQFRHPTQALEAVGLFCLGIHLLRSHYSKSILLAHYFVGYGVLRLFIEALRGDVIRGLWGPLTPSQWISLALVLVGFTTYIQRPRESQIK